MAVIALINREKAIQLVLPWASAFAQARSTSLIVVCWTPAPMINTQPTEQENQDVVEAVRAFFSQTGMAQPEVIGISGPSDTKAIVGIAREKAAELVVAAANDPNGRIGATYSTNPLLKQSPCNTIVLFGDATRSTEVRRVFVGATDNANDWAAVYLAGHLAQSGDVHVTLARAEFETEQEDIEVGRRELRQLIRDTGVDDTHFDCEVFQSGHYAEVATAMDENDLVLLGANCHVGPTLIGLTQRPTVAVIQRAPPLRPWQAAKHSANWTPRLSPADYAELIQGLRRGSRLGADFITMLSLAAIVASLGLLQDSPAVVIGSMLLAPLMTPMVGCGLALAQANHRLGNAALGTVGVGLLCTLAISYLIGLIAPGTELTPQIYARGEPTVLDLVVALASAAAAAYALARPNLVGSVAGVAIATALVPPLCSVGLSLAYRDVTNAQGSALLFITNFLAIVLSAALTFRLLGVTAKHVSTREKSWVILTLGALCISVILVCVPLQQALLRSLVDSKPQPRAYPLAKTVIDALEERIESEPEVQLITAGRPSSHLASSDVLLVLGTTAELDSSFSEELVEIVRQEMRDPSIVVEVHCVMERWHATSP